MNKYLELSFKNAGLILPHNNKGFSLKNNEIPKDKLPYSVRFDNSRMIGDRFVEPITIYQISNVIRKLFGERPIPTFRYISYECEKNDYSYKKASDSYLKIDNILDNNGNFIKENFTTNKALHNAYSKIIILDWYKVKTALNTSKNENNYNEFIDLIKKLYNLTPNDIKFSDFVDYINNNDKDKFNEIIEFLAKCKKATLINDKGSVADSTKTNGIKRFVNKGVDKIVYFKGNIYIPINEDDIEKIKNGPGTATILDGGLVKIEGILNEEDLPDPDHIRKVGEIPTKQLKDLENENKN